MIRERGFSLPEILIAVVVLGIIATIALPNLHEIMTKQQGKIVVRQLLLAINYARSEAIKTEQAVILCGGDAKTYCTEDWSAGYVLLQKQADHTTIIKPYLPVTGKLHWKGTREGLYFSATGFLNVNNGKFYWQSLDNKQQIEIIVNRLGRISVKYVN